jgi:uncharacterized membrane protein (UPF0127 family)
LKQLLTLLFATLSLGAFGQGLPVVQLQAGLYKIQAEVASTPKAREIGLMYRNFMPSDDGMLFVFESRAGHCFWMRNTKIPLSIAFIQDDGKIVNIENMKPMTEDHHCPTEAVRYALEMNQGWFTKKGIGAGQTISGLPR